MGKSKGKVWRKKMWIENVYIGRSCETLLLRMRYSRNKYAPCTLLEVTIRPARRRGSRRRGR